jgi:serine protease Do
MVVRTLKPMFLKLTLAALVAALVAMTLPLAPRVQAAPLIPETFAEIAEKSSPAVVKVDTQRKEKISGPRFGIGPLLPGPGPRDPFGDPFDRLFPEIPRERTLKSLGSGFIIDPKGLVITNYHVVENAVKIWVKLVNGKQYKAVIKGHDKATDLALLQITPENKETVTFPSLHWGDSAAMKVGDWVLAIGNPLGLGTTVTQGIISAKARVIGAGRYDNFLQTDAAINHGNSGGPLLNLKGEVIGINTAIAATGQGIGFAIPSNDAKFIIQQVLEKGKVVRGWLGVKIQPVTPEMAEAFKLPEPKGVLVVEVVDSPAEKAGLKREDIIIEFNGQPINERNELPRLVAATPPGSKATLKIIREGKEKTLTITVGEMKEEQLAQDTPAEMKSPVGIEVEDLDERLARRFGLKSTKGVVVTQVKPGTSAAEAGLRRGDVILEVNGQAVINTGGFKKLVGDLPAGSYARFLISREGQPLILAVQIPEK